MSPAERWTDEVLDRLRLQGDPRAHQAVEELQREHGARATALVFATMSANDTPLPPDAPRPLKEFFADTSELPPGVDHARLQRGEQVFMTHAFPAVLVLLTKSLPSGYAAPNLTLILNLSGDLIRSPYRRVLGVLQMIVNVCSPRGFEPDGKAIVTAQKLRLLHEGVRRIARQRLPGFEKRYGVPVNHEDMMATVVAFSYLVLEGFRRLELGLTRDEEEDYYYVWRVFAQLMGIPPDGIPVDVKDAAAFYAAYARRHYVRAAANPDGVALADANLRMLRRMIPRPLRWLGLGIVPRLYMRELMLPQECKEIGLRPVRGHRLLRQLLHHLPSLWLRPWQGADRRDWHVHAGLSRLIFQGLIDRTWSGEVRFLVPESLADLRKLA